MYSENLKMFLLHSLKIEGPNSFFFFESDVDIYYDIFIYVEYSTIILVSIYLYLIIIHLIIKKVK